MVRVAINGFGRIGRNVFKVGYKEKDIEFVAVNDLASPEILAHLLKYDSIYGKFEAEVKCKENKIIAGERELVVCNEPDPENLPWKELDIDIVVESTGRFTFREGAEKHIKAGAKKVIISAPAKEPDITIVMGVNQEKYDAEKHNIISNASCTTNCLAPVAKVLSENFGIIKGFLTTCHAYTAGQRILDLPHKDFRRARAAGVSIIPTTTGAAKAIHLVLPELEGKLDAISLRVPVPCGSINDLVVELEKEASAEEINSALKKASENELKGILQYIEEPVVSRDIIGNPHSAIVDGLLTKTNKNLAKVLAWYDNEWGFSNRMVDLIKYIAERM